MRPPLPRDEPLAIEDQPADAHEGPLSQHGLPATEDRDDRSEHGEGVVQPDLQGAPPLMPSHQTQCQVVAHFKRAHSTDSLSEALERKTRRRSSIGDQLHILRQWNKYGITRDTEAPPLDQRMTTDELERLHPHVNSSVLKKQLRRCTWQKWYLWSARELREVEINGQIAEVYGIHSYSKKGRKSEEFHPLAMKEKLAADLKVRFGNGRVGDLNVIRKSWQELGRERVQVVLQEQEHTRERQAVVMQQALSGKMDWEEAYAAFGGLSCPSGKMSVGSAARFRDEFGFKGQRERKSRKELRFDDPKLITFRKFAAERQSELGTPDELVANCDPTWRTKADLRSSRVLAVDMAKQMALEKANVEISVKPTFRQAGTLLWTAYAVGAYRTWHGPCDVAQAEADKHADMFKALVDAGSRNAAFDKLMQTSFRLRLRKRKRSAAEIQAEPPRQDLPGDARVPHTNMTWLYKNGEFGMIRIQFGCDGISNEAVEACNKTGCPEVKVVKLEKKSHMFDAEVFVDWFATDCRDEFRRRRAELEERGAVPDVWVKTGIMILDSGPDHVAWTAGQQLRLKDTSICPCSMWVCSCTWVYVPTFKLFRLRCL